MRLLLINPNTTPEVTRIVEAAARAVVPEDVTLAAETGAFGARYISTRAASAVAAHAALDAFARHEERCDAVLLACFGDPGLAALKEIAPVPVVGMAEAACLLACTLGARFAIVTGGERWGPMLREFVAAQGLSLRCAGIRTVAPTGGEIARDPEGATGLLAQACTDAIRRDGADVVILGGAALAGLAARVQPAVPGPVLCSLEAGVEVALAAARLRRRAGGGDVSREAPSPSTGLSPALASHL
jgi:Asp/Glu/hydantoin racemase